ncbi:VanZ family protein [Cellulomonas sp. P5_C5]
MSGRKRVVVALLAAVGVAAAVLVLNPWALQDRAIVSLAGLTSVDLPPVLTFRTAEVAANVALFVPLGLLSALLVPRNRWWAVLLALVTLSVGIETLQALGLPYRTASGMDVVTNSLGAAIGVGLATLVRRVDVARA